MESSTKTTKDSSKATKESRKSSGVAPVHKVLGPTDMGNQQYVPEPPLAEEKRRIYQSRVLIPISVSGKTHAMLGPLLDATVNLDSRRDFFPTYHCYNNFRMFPVA